MGDAPGEREGALDVGVSEDGGGQRTEVGHPYDGAGGVQRGVESKMHRDEGRRAWTFLRRLRAIFLGRPPMSPYLRPPRSQPRL